MDGMVLSYIPAGTFLMGSESGFSNERPVHSVTFGRLLDGPDRGDQCHVCLVRGG